MVPRRHPTATPSLLAVLLTVSLVGSAGSSRQPDTPTADAEPLARIERIIVNGIKRDQATAAEVKVIHAQAVVPAAPALSLFAGDEVITGVNVSLTLIMLDAAAEQGNTVVIGPASQFSIRGKRSVFLTFGRLLADVRGLFDVLTSRATLGARSTEFEVRVTEDDTRLTVLEGVVDMQQPLAPLVARRPEPVLPFDVRLLRATFRPDGPGVAPGAPQPPPAEQWSVVVRGRQPARTRYPLTITNRCKQRHLYDVEGPEALTWFHLFSSERIQVDGGQSRSVEIEIQVDASNVKEDTYKGNGIIKCLDCFSEPGCTQNRDPWGIQVTVGAAGALSVQALEEVSISGPGAAARPIKVTEERLRSVVNWTTDSILAGQPSYSAKRIIPHFDSVEERARVFREARFGALWRQDVESYQTLGNVYSDWGNGAKAVEAYSRLVNQPGRRSDAGFLSSMAEAHRMKGHLDEAEDYTRRALEANRDEVVTLNTLGNIYLDRAEIENDPQQVQAFLQRAGSAYQRAAGAAQPTTAVGGVARANIGDVHLALGSLAHEQRRYDAAHKEFASANGSFKAAHSLYPRYAFSRVGWGEAFRGHGEASEAQRNSSNAHDMFRSAEAHFKTGLQAHPDLPDAHVGLGDVLLDQGRPQEALASYARAIRARPTEPSGYYRLGIMLQKENPALASRFLQTHLQLRPGTFKNARTARHAAEIISTIRVKAAVSVPDLKNLQEQAARDAVARNNLEVGTVSRRPAGNVRAGVVIEQRPPAGTAVAVGSTVDFVLAGGTGTGGGTEPLVVPDVLNRPVAEAVALIEAAGLGVGRIERKRSNRPDGTVTKQTPSARNRVKAGTVVALEVAEREIRTVSVPDVVGDDRARAIQKIQEKGLRVGGIREQASCEQQGEVISQVPAEDSRVPTDTTVSLVVAGPGAAAARVPRVTGLHETNAVAAIRESRLTVRKVDRRETDRQSPGTVLDQKPDANTPLSPGCPVDIVIAVPIPLVDVPRFIGLSEAEARRRLPGGAIGILAELRLGRVTYQNAGDSANPGADATVYRRQITTPTVIAQDPAPNSRVRRGTPVDLVVLRPRGDAPPPTSPVPSVVGMERSRAEAEIKRAGLRVGQVSHESTKVKAGTVIRQSPDAGARVRPATPVNLVIAAPYIR